MAYQTGTAADFVALLGALNTFATANGWTANLWSVDSGSDWRLHLSKGSQYVNFLAQPLGSLWIVGSDGFDSVAAWNAQPVSSPQTVRMTAANSTPLGGTLTWPVTYHLFAHSSPDSIELVIETMPATYQWMMFGVLNKFGTWSGGAYVGASWGTAIDRLNYTADVASAIFANQTELQESGGGAGQTRLGLMMAGGRAANTGGAFSDAFNNCWMRVAIDSQTWLKTSTANGADARFNADNHAFPLPRRSVSAFNGLMSLTPIWPMMYRPDAHWSCLGRVEHVRYANVINHLPGQVIDLGPDRWMLFPWLSKGSYLDSAGLHAGFAVRYDGP